MITTPLPLVSGPAVRRGGVRFTAHDVTGSFEIDVNDVDPASPAGAVAQAVAARLELPLDTPWVLRSDRSGAWLRDDTSIGEQMVENQDASFTLAPKAHLGGGSDR